jgi:hypothetical protein
MGLVRLALIQEWCSFMNDWYLNVTAVGEWLYRLRHLLQSMPMAHVSGEESCNTATNPALSLYRQIGDIVVP